MSSEEATDGVPGSCYEEGNFEKSKYYRQDRGKKSERKTQRNLWMT